MIKTKKTKKKNSNGTKTKKKVKKERLVHKKNVTKKIKTGIIIKKVEKEKVKEVEIIPAAKIIVPKVKGIPYFTKETEDAIVAYNKASSQTEKNELYNDKIKYAFEKIAENVYNTFKFSYADMSPLEIQKQAISHMVSNIDKYEPGKGKAFSYFSIVAKHWFILDNNNTYRRFKRHVEICEHPGDSGEFVIEPEHRRKDTEAREFIGLMVKFWDSNVNKYFNKDRDIKIANAIVEIFRNCDRIDVYNKKALYLYIREIAGCQTQHITKVINKMRDAQGEITEEYLLTGDIFLSEQDLL